MTVPEVKAASGDGERYYMRRLDEIIAEEQKKGLVGFALFPTANTDCTPDDLAKEAAEMMDAYRAGNVTDVTDCIV